MKTSKTFTTETRRERGVLSIRAIDSNGILRGTALLRGSDMRASVGDPMVQPHEFGWMRASGRWDNNDPSKAADILLAGIRAVASKKRLGPGWHLRPTR